MVEERVKLEHCAGVSAAVEELLREVRSRGRPEPPQSTGYAPPVLARLPLASER